MSTGQKSIEAGAGRHPGSSDRKEWLSFAHARGEVMRARQAGEAEAQDWLYEAAREFRVPVRFVPETMLRNWGNLEAARRGWAPPKHLEDEEGPQCEWYNPLDYMKREGSRPVSRLCVEHDTEWHGPALRLALGKMLHIAKRPAPEEDGLPKAKRGAPRKYDWDAIGPAFLNWLHDKEGRAELPFPACYDAVVELAHNLGHDDTPDQETVRPHVRRWKATYLKTLRKRKK
jgi:hypothetical protein